MAFVMAGSIDDAGWVVGNGKLTDFLVLAALGGVVAGFVGSKVGWNRWLAQGLGAVFAALIVPILVGQVLAPGQSVGYQFRLTAEAAATAWGRPDHQPACRRPGRSATTCWSSACCAGRPASSPRRRSSATTGR